MSHKRFLTAVLAAVLVVGLLIVGGSAIRQSAWSQGYMMGQLAAGGDGAVAPYAPYGYPGRFFGYSSSLCGVGPLFTLGLLFLLFVVVGKAFRFWAWKKVSGPEGERWAKHWAEHWRRHHGHRPPWCWDQEKAEQAEPDAGAGDAEAAN